MIVQWIEFDTLAYDLVRKTDELANPKDFEKSYEGKVLDKYHTFWGTPKFVVALADGEIVTVPMEKCRIVKMSTSVGCYCDQKGGESGKED